MSSETDNSPGICWVNGKRQGGETIEDVKYTIAHEIAHVLTGGGHPDDDEDPGQLNGTNRPLRLLLSGDNLEKLTPHGIQLVKAEWDAADERLPGILQETKTAQ